MGASSRDNKAETDKKSSSKYETDWVNLGPEGPGTEEDGPEEDWSGKLVQNTPKPPRRNFVSQGLRTALEYASKLLGTKDENKAADPSKPTSKK